MSKKMTRLARGLKCGCFGASGGVNLRGSAPAHSACKAVNANQPKPAAECWRKLRRPTVSSLCPHRFMTKFSGGKSYCKYRNSAHAIKACTKTDQRYVSP